ncbi:hypothetical protein LFZ31_18300, partial [Salmonella enterica subsp. enterica serovar Newport str. S09097]
RASGLPSCANWVAALPTPHSMTIKTRLRHHQRQYATAFTGYKAQRKQRASRRQSASRWVAGQISHNWRPSPLTRRFGA